MAPPEETTPSPPDELSGWRGCCVASLALGLAVPTIVLALLSPTSVGGWVDTLFGGSGVRWEEAYRALGGEPADAVGPRSEEERLRLAWAPTEGAPPKGVTLGPRRRRPGVLVRLRYETVDAQGRPLDSWLVRALIPPLPSFGDDAPGAFPALGVPACPPACETALARTNGVRLTRSGQAGVAVEWLLRMPIGETADLGPRPLVTQDILASQPRRLGASAAGPASVRVTLLGECRAQVRVGRITTLRFAEGRLPLPRGFDRRYWAQLEGCTSELGLLPAAAMVPAPAPH